MFEIKRIDQRDAKLLSELSIQTFLDAYQQTHSRKDLEEYCQQFYSESACKSLLKMPALEAMVAFDGGSAAGFYTIRHHACPIDSADLKGLQQKATELKQIYILQQYYGVGLGKTLFDSAVSVAMSNQSEWLWLCVSNKNLRAQKFYNQLGFSRIGDGPELIVGDDSLSSSIMALHIAPVMKQ